MTALREEMKNKTVRVNITLPRYLRDFCEEAGLNFSSELQVALKMKFDLYQRLKKDAQLSGSMNV